jgi:hypothetical protein
MGIVFTIKADLNNHSNFTINPKTAAQINMSGKKQAYIRFGSKRHYVKIKMSESVSENVILLSNNLFEDLYLPDYLTYEVSVNKNEISLGPFIGMLIKKEDKDFTDSCLRKLLIYTKAYSNLNGAVVVFALDKVDNVKLLIEGFCYNPGSGNWQRGIFPYPSAIYRKIGLNEQWKNHFLTIMGDRVFNNYYFNKWSMYKWLSSSCIAGPHLPYTMLYTSYNDVLNLLKKFNKVYIKPTSGLKGHGVVQASMNGESMILRFREKGENNKVSLNSIDEIRDYMDKRFSDRGYIVQQGIELLKYDEKIVDFRCVLQKNQWNMWECMAVFGKCGEIGSVVSNISSGGTIFHAEELLGKALYPYHGCPDKVKENVESLAVKVCCELDECGINCGFLGLDIGMDVYGYLWLIEINNRDPSLLYALGINDKKLYYRLKSYPLYYAKFLAGFYR